MSLKWFNSYLINRSQVVKINGVFSNPLTLNCRVPLLGSLLFIMYLNSICNLEIYGKIITYADDTCLIFADDSWENLKKKAIIETKKVIKYFNYKKLTVNYKKTMFMCLKIYNSNKLLDEFTSLHLCENNITCKSTQCQNISRV